ncbi:hypothetical protein RBH26_13280 [Natronolimnohabitans sp. A-GB9]|uniref:hypothetical protein n=1 Tax=Natronolimnohabitans sp. A-GB9 TaxID=3069757 RepID=UPI0027B81633|nr:hypothetical protein [Natronolimnohabitans sp. A-GB9]MDQ2051450.1 hypothetical protein [Natronolimnohabitans sp. A-GB9]
MSKNDAVSELDGNRDHESDRIDDGETVDLGIGIAVDIDVDVDEAAGCESDHVELTYDEDDKDGVVDATDGIDANATDPDRRLESDADERDALEAAGVDPDVVREKAHSYRMLVDAGVDEELADALRRRFSLPWSFDGESNGDLERRSSEIRGLGAAEREWIAASDGEDWQSFEYDSSPLAAVGRERPSERPWPKPTPVTAVVGVGPEDADRLAEAGIRSAERLATIDAFDVADALDLDVLHVRTWRYNARELLE